MSEDRVFSNLAELVHDRELVQDSRQVVEGSLFFLTCRDPVEAVRYANDAAMRGAAAIITDLRGDLKLDVAVPVIRCANPRRLLARLSALKFGEPARRLLTVAVTGTSGKTTASEYASAVLTAAGLRTRIVGSIHPVAGGEGYTTPPAPALQRALAGFVAEGVEAVVLEVSSHGIDQERVAGIPFRGAILTNLGRDHLDYHRSLVAYWETKARLFQELASDAVASLPAERRVVTVMGRVRARVVTYGARNADVRLLADEGYLPGGRRVRLDVRGRILDGTVHVPGAGAVRSALAAVALGVGLGFPPEVLVEAISQVRQVPGRMQVSELYGRQIWIDYAHNPAGLEVCLNGVRELTRGEVWHIFGARGRRDAGKLQAMGRISARLADHTLLTTDLPEGEDPERLAERIQRGLWPKKGLFIRDRYEAVRLALLASRPGDAIVLTGRGQEPAVEIAPGVVQPSDMEILDRLRQDADLQEEIETGRSKAGLRHLHTSP